MIQKIIKIRHLLQGTVILFLISAAWFNIPATFCAINIGLFQLICPVGFIEVSFATKSIITSLLPGVLLVILMTLLVGKSFCAWACPSRFAGSLIHHIGNKKIPKATAGIIAFWNKLKNRIQSHVSLTWGDGLALLSGLLIGICLFSFPAYSIICPVGIISRNIIEFITHLRLRMDLSLLAIPLLLSLFFKFGWKCACPLGLVRGKISISNKTLIPVVNPDLCRGCGICMDNCTSGVDLHLKKYDGFACSKCFNCLRDCPHNAITIGILPEKLFQSKTKQIIADKEM